jgi:hypothetical protein
MSLSESVVENLRKTVETACADPTRDIPGTSIVIVNSNGTEIFAHAAGQRSALRSEPMTLSTVFWIASCTKMIVGAAIMQLVEQGKRLNCPRNVCRTSTNVVPSSQVTFTSTTVMNSRSYSPSSRT